MAQERNECPPKEVPILLMSQTDASAKASDKTRRLFNKAVFKKVTIRDGRIAEAEYQDPFDAFFAMPEFEYATVVEPSGLEPPTSCLQSRRSTN